jgi:hypothetical protein
MEKERAELKIANERLESRVSQIPRNCEPRAASLLSDPFSQ